MRLRAALAGLLLTLAMLGTAAQEAPLLAADPALETRVMALSEELRCLVCQNESLAASHAALAVDLREQIREKLRAGQSEQQVVDFLVARYGEFVLYRPRWSATTWLLWLGPFLLLLTGVVALLRIIRRQAGVAGHAEPDAELSAEQKLRARELLGGARQTHP